MSQLYFLRCLDLERGTLAPLLPAVVWSFFSAPLKRSIKFPSTYSNFRVKMPSSVGTIIYKTSEIRNSDQ